MRAGFYDKALDMTAEEILAWKVKRIVARFKVAKEFRSRVLAR